MAMVKSASAPEDHAATRQALCSLFISQEDFELCGDAENGQEAVEIAQLLRPDLIVLDLSMPVMDGIAAARVLKQLMPTVPIIVFSEYSDVLSEHEAETEGISALVSKSESVSVLLDKARSVLTSRDTSLFHLLTTKRRTNMFTRVVELTSKSGKSKELSNMINEKAIPILKQQRGFQDEIVLVSDTEPDRILGVSFWDTREDAERYHREQFATIKASVRHLLESEPVVRTFNVHTYIGQKIAAHKAA